MEIIEDALLSSMNYPCVLFVDDEEALLASVRRMLRTQCILKTCDDPHEALKLLRQSPDQFDAIISDMMMPGLNGVEFLAEARSISPDTPRILLSGSLTETALREAINKAGIARVLVKPIPAHAILNTVRDIVSEETGEIRPSRLMVQRMRTALKEDHTVVFQRRVHAQDFNVIGTEALSRFPELQNTFTLEEIITGAEDHPVIGALTFKVLDFIIHHREILGSKYGAVPVSVNLSPHSVSDSNFVNNLLDFLSTCRNLPKLEFEITEQSNLAFTAEFQKNLPRLRAAGYPVFIDDFGAGNNSMSLLRKGHFSGLKLDKSLIARLDDHNTIDSSFVEWVTQAAHQLGMTVVAEGVETLDAATFLQHIGVDELQGYFFGHPEPLPSPN